MSVARVPRALRWTPARAGAARGLLREALRVAPLLVLYVAICALAQPGPHPVRDEQDLLAAAGRMLDGQLVPGGHLPDPRAYLWHGPGLVALLAPLVALQLPLGPSGSSSRSSSDVPCWCSTACCTCASARARRWPGPTRSGSTSRSSLSCLTCTRSRSPSCSSWPGCWR